MNKEILIKLLKEENYPAHMVDATIAKLNKIQPIVLESHIKFWSMIMA